MTNAELCNEATIETNGLDEEIRCAMCKNPMRSDSGCDGNCQYDEKLYKKIMDILDERIKPLQSVKIKLYDDLIDRQAAIDALGEEPMVWMDSDYELAERNQWNMDKLAIETVPSAQPEIIRCRDCEHWDKTWTNNWLPDYHYCPIIDEVRKGDFCCRYAERRTDE